MEWSADKTRLESLLLRDRWILGGTLVLVIALSWAWIAPMAVDMYGAMRGSAAWMMTRRWDLAHQALPFAMWTVMMTGMMLPSAAPALFLYASVLRKSPEADLTTARVYAFGGGYLAAWTLFSLFVTVLQLLLTRWLVLSPMMEIRSHLFGAALLILGGVYQLTPFKQTCLVSCRSPALFITRHWKPGRFGGFRMGLRLGWHCLGCCWALMLLLFVGGVMNLWWIVALTLFVLLEKLATLGVQGGRLSGWLIIGWGVWTFLK